MRNTEKAYEIIEHTSDIGIRTKGRDFKEALEKVIIGFYDLITPVENIGKKIEKRLIFEKEEKEEIVHTILSELLFLFDTEGFVGSSVKVNEGKTYTITIKGDIFNPERHRTGFSIKAVTYHLLSVKENNHCTITVIFDV